MKIEILKDLRPKNEVELAIRGLPRKLATTLAMISALSFSAPQPALAYSVTDYVPPGSCASEVAQLGAGADDETINRELTAPWVYRYASAGSLQSPREMIAYAKAAEDAAVTYQTQNSTRDAALSRLRACAYRTAAANMSARVRQLAPNGLPHRVTLADCAGEQQAYAAAYKEDTRSSWPRPPESTGRELAAGFVEGVAYNDVLYNNGRGMTPDVYEGISKPHRVTGMALHDAGNALQACVYGLTYQRGGGKRSAVALNAPVTAPLPPSDPCVQDKLAAVNGEITGVEARLDRFMSESPYVKAEGLKNATPMLQVTIWGLEQSVAALKKHCPASAMASERIAELESSLKHAKAACDQIQAGGRKCVATEPEQVM